MIPLSGALQSYSYNIEQHSKLRVLFQNICSIAHETEPKLTHTPYLNWSRITDDPEIRRFLPEFQLPLSTRKKSSSLFFFFRIGRFPLLARTLGCRLFKSSVRIFGSRCIVWEFVPMDEATA